MCVIQKYVGITEVRKVTLNNLIQIVYEYHFLAFSALLKNWLKDKVAACGKSGLQLDFTKQESQGEMNAGHDRNLCSYQVH